MKKILPYIFVLVAAFGVFVFPPKAIAAEDICVGLTPGSRAWDSNGCTPARAIPATPMTTTTNESLGKCTEGTTVTADTKTACEGRGGTWAANAAAPMPVPLTPTVTCKSNETLVNGKCTKEDPSKYTLLAPLSPELNTFDTSQPNAFSTYLNIMIKIFIGICAVLAMLMIVIGGLEYMTSELISSKEHGKERIMNAIFGLLLALGSYALLNTINPDLLKVEVAIDPATLQVFQDEQEAPPTPADYATSAPSGAVNLCTTGVQQITTSNKAQFIVCNTIAIKLQNMVNLANAQGIHLSGGGFRTKARQIQLRAQNCGGNNDASIYQKPSSSCRPPTAVPGTSRHESGLAIDLKCDGDTIHAHDNKCFIWLSQNAAAYGFYNYPPEAWHWSTDGK